MYNTYINLNLNEFRTFTFMKPQKLLMFLLLPYVVLLVGSIINTSEHMMLFLSIMSLITCITGPWGALFKCLIRFVNLFTQCWSWFLLSATLLYWQEDMARASLWSKAYMRVSESFVQPSQMIILGITFSLCQCSSSLHIWYANESSITGPCHLDKLSHFISSQDSQRFQLNSVSVNPLS